MAQKLPGPGADWRRFAKPTTPRFLRDAALFVRRKHMDAISHALIGACIGECTTEERRWRVAWPALFAFLPDVPSLLVAYPYVGWLNGRRFWIPEYADWDGFRSLHPVVSAFWEAPHSILFVLLFIVPLVHYAKLPRLCVPAYLSHIITDWPSHTAEWALAPFWPIPWRLEGWSDPWRWPAWAWLVSAASCAGVWLLARHVRGRIVRARAAKASSSEPPSA